MTGISLLVNGSKVERSVEPRVHLADFLRETLHLTGTHLRCEQGVCGACTVLIDGAPARSCITYAVSCQEAEITTIEGLEDDPIMERLRDAFTREHGLQCGFCTPGMLITARDIVTRLRDADERRVRIELSGNLCRCTGYTGIVRAICRVLEERRLAKIAGLPQRTRLGPVGARRLDGARAPVNNALSTAQVHSDGPRRFADLGLGSRSPNMESQVAITVRRPADEVWAALGDIERVARCMPGASLTSLPSADPLQGRVAIKVGPISTSFDGAARIVRNEKSRQGTLHGTGRDRLTGSSARAEVVYRVRSADADATRVELSVQALLTGPLAQFSRGQIVQDLLTRLAGEFARRLEYSLEHGDENLPVQDTALRPWALLRSALAAKLRVMFPALFRKRGPWRGLNRGE